MLVHPLLEGLTHDGVDDVGQVATAEFGDLLRGRQHVLNVLRLGGEGKDFLDGEALEMGHVDDLDLLAADDLFDPHGEVTQVPNGDCLVAGEVGPNFRGEEAIDFYE